MNATVRPPAKLRHIPEFDGLRGLMALWVALSHVFCWCGLADLPQTVPHRVSLLWTEFSYAGGAVDTFIILSGFVIAYLLYTRPQTYRQFMVGRAFRICPVYFVCLAFGVAVIHRALEVLNGASWKNVEYLQHWVKPVAEAQISNTMGNLLAHLTLLFGIIPDKLLPGNPFAFVAPAWSITLEWQFYLLAPLLLLLVTSRRGLCLVGLISCGGFIYAHLWGSAFLPVKLPLFLVGIASFHFYRWAHDRGSLPHYSYWIIAALSAIFTIAWHALALGIWILVFGGLFTDQNGPRPASRPDHVAGWLNDLRQLLRRRPLKWMGEISYPLYLVHWPMIILLMSLLLHWQPHVNSFNALCIMLLLGIPLILLIAWILHVVVEAPLMRWGKQINK